MTTEEAMLAVPMEMLAEAGFYTGNPIQIHVSVSRIIIESLDDSGKFICSGDCDDCLFSEVDCDGECDICPCHVRCDESEES